MFSDILNDLKQQSIQNSSLLKEQTTLFAQIATEVSKIGSIVKETNKQLRLGAKQTEKFDIPPFFKTPLEKPTKQQRTVSPSAQQPTTPVIAGQPPLEQQPPIAPTEEKKPFVQPVEQQPIDKIQTPQAVTPIPSEQPTQPGTDSSVLQYAALAAGAAFLSQKEIGSIMKEVLKGVFEGMFSKDVPEEIQKQTSEKTKEIQKLAEDVNKKKPVEVPVKEEPKKEPPPAPAPPPEAPKPPPPAPARTVPWERTRPAPPPAKEPTIAPERIEVAPLKEEPKLVEAPKIEPGKAPSKVTEVAPQRIEVAPTKVGVPKLAEAPKIERIPAQKPAAVPAGPPPAPSIKPTEPTLKPAVEVKPSSGGVFSSADDFVKGLMPYAQKVSQLIGGKVPPIAILGQWAGESGYGKSLPADFNYAGIKAGKQFEKGDYVLTEERYTDAQLEAAKRSGETLHRVLGQDDKMKKKGRDVTVDEWYGKGAWQAAKSEGKNWVQVKSYFAKFKSLDDFAENFAKFISSPRYAKAREQTTAAGFGFEIAKAGYATASAEKYSQKIASFEQQYGNKVQPTGGTMVAQAPSTGQAMNQTSGDVAFKQKQQSKEPTPIINVVDNSTVVQRRKGSAPQSDSPSAVYSALT